MLSIGVAVRERGGAADKLILRQRTKEAASVARASRAPRDATFFPPPPVIVAPIPTRSLNTETGRNKIAVVSLMTYDTSL